MKESVCVGSAEKATPRVYEFCVRSRTADTTVYRVNVDSTQISVPFALFSPEPLEILFLRSRDRAAPQLEPRLSPFGDTHAAVFGDQLPIRKSTIPLQHIIANTIAGVDGIFNQQRMFSRVLLVGGGGMMDGAKELFEDVIFEVLPAQVERVEVIPIQTGPTAATCAYVDTIEGMGFLSLNTMCCSNRWRGAAIVGLQMPRAMWIDRGKWLSRGPLVLRERLPFAWDRLSS